MKHATMWLMALALAVSAMAYAGDEARPSDQPARMETGMMQCPMMGTMGAADLAAWGGSVYLLSGTTLSKLDRDGKIIKWVDLPDMSEQMKAMHENGMCPMTGTMWGQRGPGMRDGWGTGVRDGQGPGPGPGMRDGTGPGPRDGQRPGMRDGTGPGPRDGQRPGMRDGTGPGPRDGQGPGMRDGWGPGMRDGTGPGPRDGWGPGMGMQMGQMRRMRMMSNPSVAADAGGVYVLRAGEMTVYDLDLNKISSAEVIDLNAELAPCPMCAEMGAQAEPIRARGTGRAIAMSGGAWGPNPNIGEDERPKLVGFSQPRARAMMGGEVTLQNRPVSPSGGLVTLYIGVLDVNGEPNPKATVSAYLYRNDKPKSGSTVRLMRSGPGYSTGHPELAGAGPWELAVRVKRPGMADARVYFSLGTDQ